MLCTFCPLTILRDFYRFPEKSPKWSADKMYRACALKDQTLKKIRTLHFPDYFLFLELFSPVSNFCQPGQRLFQGQFFPFFRAGGPNPPCIACGHVRNPSLYTWASLLTVALGSFFTNFWGYLGNGRNTFSIVLFRRRKLTEPHWVLGQTRWVRRRTRWVRVYTQIIGWKELTEFAPRNSVSPQKLTELGVWNRTPRNRIRPVSE